MRISDFQKVIDDRQPWFLQPQNRPYIDLFLAIFRPEDWAKLQQMRKKNAIVTKKMGLPERLSGGRVKDMRKY